MQAKEISLDQAKPEKLFYFVANVVVYRESDQRCLILKRHPREKVHPERWGVIGGKLEWADLPLNQPTRINGDVLDFEDAVERLLQREAREEAGIEIGPQVYYLNSVAFIRPDGIPVILVKFAVKFRGGNISLEKGAFVDYAWVNSEEVKSYSTIDGVPNEVAQTLALFKVG